MSEERLADIENKLTRCVTLLESLEKSQEERHRIDKEWRAKTDRLLYGKNGAPGMTVRIDRLEQSHERTKWLVRVLVAGLVSLGVGLLMMLVIK